MNFSLPLWQGKAIHFDRLDVYPWMALLSDREDIFCSLWSRWGTPDLPQGYDYYLVSYHTETIDLNWLKNQTVDGKIIVLFPGKDYNLSIPNIQFISYMELHNDLDKMIKWHGYHKTPQEKKNKFGTVCNRVTQSKIWTTTQILESESNSLIILNPDYFKNKNVHNWELTGVDFLDNLTNIFRKKYINLKLSDGFDNNKDNVQRVSSNPWQPLYTDVALHIVAGSFHYSLMNDYIYPGPDIDEKTLKCLLAGVAFLPGMQFEVYNWLEKFGLQFNYKFDTCFDSDEGNLSRFETLCKLIDTLSHWTNTEIIDATKDSTQFNLDFILSGGFKKECDKFNNTQIEQLMSALNE